MSNNIRVIFTSDVHGKVLPYSYGDSKEFNYGFSKLQHVIKTLKNDNTILIDNGDTLEGSPLQSYHFKKGEGSPSPVSKVMKEMGYDYINLGNHDFDFGIDNLLTHIEETGAKCINLNMGFDYDVKEIAGYRIAIFGVLTHFTPRWERKENLGDAFFPDTFSLVKETVDKINTVEKPDYIICVYHGGLEKDPATGLSIGKDNGENQGYRMLDEIDGLNMIIMGHQHTVTSGVFRGKAYAQPGMDGKYIAVFDIDTEGGGIVSQLISLNEIKPAPDERVLSLVEDEERECREWLDKPLGKCNIDLLVKNESEERLHKSQFITFINKVQMDRMGADISAASLFEGALGLSSNITMKELVCSYSFPNTLVLKKISGKKLGEYLEKNLEFWDYNNGNIEVNPKYLEPIPMFFNYDMLDGIEYTANICKPIGERLVSLTKDGMPIKDDDEFLIALNNYRASGGGGFSMLEDLETVKEDLTNMVDVLAEYVSRHKTIDFVPVNNIKIIAEE